MDISNSHQEIEEAFENIAGKYRIASRRDPNHNCIAFTLGDFKQVWDPNPDNVPGYYWPPGVPASAEIRYLARVFEIHGYKTCESADLEDGFDKIAICGKGPDWTHAAIQLPSGKWASKLGAMGHDVEHDTLEALCGVGYGEVVQIMKRARPTAAPSLGRFTHD